MQIKPNTPAFLQSFLATLPSECIALLNCAQLPNFTNIQANQLTPALNFALEYAGQGVDLLNTKVIGKQKITWQTVNDDLNQFTAPLSYAWGLANHLSSVLDSPVWRDAIDENLERITEFFTLLMQNPQLKLAYELLSQDKTLNAIQHKIIQDALLSFKLSGADLPQAQQQNFLTIQAEKAQVCKQISDNVLDATQAFVLWCNDEDLQGIPDAIKQSWWDNEKQAYKITLQQPCYGPVMQYANSQGLRKQLYQAAITRASEITEFNQGKIDWNNQPLIERLLTLRKQLANLLGYKNYADVSTATKMAQNAQTAFNFVEEIAQKAKPFAQKDWQQLQSHALTMNLKQLELWDTSYVAENLRQQQYSYSEQEVREYFTQSKVIEGLFAICKTLFNIEILPAKHLNTWHEDVLAYEIKANNNTIAYFYMDLYAREHKHAGAWMNSALSLNQTHEHKTLPVAYLICNFQKAMEGKEPTFTHYEVMTLFHEFGHGLHHMLTTVDYSGASGIDGVEWDAVELPSQFMENFCWNYDLLLKMTEHSQTKQTLPKALFDKMWASRTFQNGLAIIRQNLFALLDLHVHMHEAQASQNINAVAKQMHQQYHVAPYSDINRWQNTFTHVFAGGYAAGYYSYHWAEVLSADAFAAFEESCAKTGDLLDVNLGERYLQEILSRGGSRPMQDNFIAFRGRPANTDAFFESNGLILN